MSAVLSTLSLTGRLSSRHNVISSNSRRVSGEFITDYNVYLLKEKKRFSEYFVAHIKYTQTIDEFERLTLLGTGSFGRVFLIRHAPTDRYYALKVIEKKKVVELEQVEHMKSEKCILQALNNPFLTYLHFFYQDTSYLYLILPAIMGGEMFRLIRKFKVFDEDLSRFYAAQVCLGLEYLHFMNLIYRDLKPENILIDFQGYIKITDFGFCKLVKGRTYTLCGTPEYLAPEIIMNQGYNKSVDWWSFGILVYEMNSGSAPFVDPEPMILYDKILQAKYRIPQHFSVSLKDLLRNVLQRDITLRYGNLEKGVNDIKEHRWFRHINWLTLFNKKMEPPYVPELSGPTDTNNFDACLADATIKVSQTDRFAKEFLDF